MFTSRDKKAIIGYFGMAAFCAVFSIVYEMFSHHVYSIYMIGLAAFPLLLGALPCLVIGRAGGQRSPWMRWLQMMSVLTLTVGSCLSGVFEIYGTTSDYTRFFWLAGSLLLVMAAIRLELDWRKEKRVGRDYGCSEQGLEQGLEQGRNFRDFAVKKQA